MNHSNLTTNGSSEYLDSFQVQVPDLLWMFWSRWTFFGFRRFLYLVPPSESTFEHADDIPDWPDEALVWFLTFVIFEAIVQKLTGHSDNYRFNDGVTSLNGGLITMIYTLFHKGFNVGLYAWVYNNYRIVDLPWNATWVWVLCFFTQDFMAYWSHRCMHEVSLFWSFHQFHHSSQYFNIGVSTRLSIFQPWVASVFEAVNAFIIPPGIHLAHSHLSLLFQFWLHTKYIPYLGPIEYIINTPMHHRVHHGRNPYCIDKNYGVVLIIWDRIFGTFGKVKEDEPVVYGLVNNPNTFDMLYLQLFYYKYLLWDKPWFELPKGTPLKDRLLTYVYPIGWTPGSKLNWMVWWRLDDPAEGVPEVENPAQYYDPVLPKWLFFYIWGQLLTQLYVYSRVMTDLDHLPNVYTAAYVSYLLITIQSLGYIFDGKWWIGRLELARTLTYAVVFFAMAEPTMLLTMLLGSSLIWTALHIRYGIDYRLEVVDGQRFHYEALPVKQHVE